MNIILQGTFSTRQDFFTLLGRAAWGVDRPAPTNLDGMADLLREARVLSISVRGVWTVDAAQTGRIRAVLADQGVNFRLDTVN